jgi:arylsulfatase A-like enzyme
MHLPCFQAVVLQALLVGSAVGTTQPNIVFILTDDQDAHLNSLDYLPYVNQHLTKQGTTFSRHYCTNALCCPSRVSLWTGKAAHNHNVTDVVTPYGTGFASVLNAPSSI